MNEKTQKEKPDYGSGSFYETRDGATGYVFAPGEGGQPSEKKKKPDRDRWQSGRALFRGVMVAGGIVLVLCMCFLAGYTGVLTAAEKTHPVHPETDTSEENESFFETVSSNEIGNGSAEGGYTTTAEVYRAVSDSIVMVSATLGTGSGIVLSEDGYILTTYHVIKGSTEIHVTASSGKTYLATLAGKDESSDLALLKIMPANEKLKPVTIGCSGDLVPGEEIVVLGNPYGAGTALSGGMVSAKARYLLVDRNGKMMELIQIDARLLPGNSGGGLFNMDGKLVGMIYARDLSDGSGTGFGYAIPIDGMIDTLNRLKNHGQLFEVAAHGLTCIDVTPHNLSYAYYYNIKECGLYVLTSEFTDELKFRDRILTVNGTAVMTYADFMKVISDCAVGDILSIEVDREGVRVAVSLTLRSNSSSEETADPLY